VAKLLFATFILFYLLSPISSNIPNTSATAKAIANGIKLLKVIA